MPGMRCFIANCKNSNLVTRQLAGNCSSPVVSYHRFPSDRVLRRQWLKACRRKQLKSGLFTSLRVCSEHFTDDDYEPDLRAELLNCKAKKILKKCAVPHLKLTLNQNTQTGRSICMIEREKRQERKARKEIVNQLLEESLKNNILDCSDISHVNIFTECEERLAKESLNSDLEQTPVSFQQLRNASNITEVAENSVKCDKELQQKILIAENKLLTTRRELDKAMDLYHSRTAFLGSTIQNLRKEISDLKRHKPYSSTLETEVTEVLETFLSETQIKVVMSGKNRAKWTPSEIITATKLRKISEDAYVFLQKEMNYPLPEFSVLDRYATQTKRHVNVDSQKANNIMSVGIQNASTAMQHLCCEEYEIEVCEISEETTANISEIINNIVVL